MHAKPLLLDQKLGGAERLVKHDCVSPRRGSLMTAPGLQGNGFAQHLSCDRLRSVRRLACLAVALLSCGDDSNAPIDGPSVDHPPPDLSGLIFVVQAHSQPGDSTVIAALFGTGLRNTTLAREDGPCRIERATPLNALFHNAGQMRITATGPTNSIVMLPAGTQYQDAVGNYRYIGGETLLVETMGATVPALAGSITFPHPVTVMTTSSSTPLSKSRITRFQTSTDISIRPAT